MKRIVLFLFLASFFIVNAQKLHLDSALKAYYIKKYQFHDQLICIPFYCDPFKAKLYSKKDTTGLCGKFVFVDTGFNLKIKPIFEIPCSFEPRFSEGLCAVSIKNQIVFIDTSGKIKINTGLPACSQHKHRVLGFKNGKAKVYKGSNTIKKYHTTYYIDKNGYKVKEYFAINVKIKPPVSIASIEKPNTVVSNKNDTSYAIVNEFLNNRNLKQNFYPIEIFKSKMIKQKYPGSNLFLIQYECGTFQLENMAEQDSIYCGKYLFVDSFFNVKISRGFDIPCSFEPEFSEGLCAVALDSQIVYIDTLGRVVIKTGLLACSPENNKVSTFKNGIATLFKGDKNNKGFYQTIAINSNGERVKLLEFDDLELAIKKYEMFSNLSIEECNNCFVGRGKTNGIWFLIEKTGKVKKKLELKQ